MDDRLLGIPLLAWGGVCLALAANWFLIWPSHRAAQTQGLRYVILRWFHGLTWLLLAAAAFLARFGLLGGLNTAKVLAVLALATYLTFMVTLVRSGSRPAPRE
ncbi:MAG: hypothetical protein KatS3mg050_3614 [Litorilinea sp.]|nr:MAG: hypothetical protein KatS3mg050_3614 [Litorilinea sp.]